MGHVDCWVRYKQYDRQIGDLKASNTMFATPIGEQETWFSQKMHPNDLCIRACILHQCNLQSIRSQLGVWVLGTTPIYGLRAHRVHDSPIEHSP